MTDTVNVPREAAERLRAIAEGARPLDVYGSETFVDAGNSFRADLCAMLAAAPKAEPVSDPYKLEGPDAYLLVKRGLYYRPNAQGYTGIKDHAGRYSKAEAEDHAHDGVAMLLADEAPEFSASCLHDLAVDHLQNKLSAARAEIVSLRQPLSNPQQLEGNAGSRLRDIFSRHAGRANDSAAFSLAKPDNSPDAFWDAVAFDLLFAQPEAQKGEPVGEIAKVIDFAGTPTEVVWADKMPPVGTKLYTRSAPSSELLGAMKAAITKIAQISEAWGWGAGEPASEIAGGIVSYLAANPAEIESFLQNPSSEQSMAACRAENGCLTWRAMTGEIMDRETYDQRLAKHKGPQ